MKQQPAGKSIAVATGVFLFFTLLSISSFAQFSIGIEGGYNRNYLQTNNANRDFTNYQPANGFSVGIPVQYQLANWFAVEADPTYIKKAYSLVRTSFYQGTYQTNTNAYLQLPIIGHFMFGGKKLQGFFNLGMYGGYWTTGNVKGRLPNILNSVDSVTASNTTFNYNVPYSYNEKYTFDTRRDNRIEAGWLAGAGVSYLFANKYNVFAEGRYMQAITDQQKNYMINQVPRYNQTYAVNIGCMMRIRRKTKNKH